MRVKNDKSLWKKVFAVLSLLRIGSCVNWTECACRVCIFFYYQNSFLPPSRCNRISLYSPWFRSFHSKHLPRLRLHWRCQPKSWLFFPIITHQQFWGNIYELVWSHRHARWSQWAFQVTITLAGVGGGGGRRKAFKDDAGHPPELPALQLKGKLP